MAWASLVPVFIAFGCLPTHVVFRRDLRTMFLLLGLLLDDTFNHVIKHSLEMPRPPHTCAALEVCDSHGMPSAHSQFMAFFATFATWLACYKLDYEDERWRWVTAVLPWPFTFLTMASRVYLGYHTIPQVLAGFTLGIFSGSFWFYVVHRVFVPFFPAISDSAWGRYLCIKDDCHIRNGARGGAWGRVGALGGAWRRYLCIKDDCHFCNVAVVEYLNSQRARQEQRATEVQQEAQKSEQEKLLEKVQREKEDAVDGQQQEGKQQQAAEESMHDGSAKME
ncbi:unnamed protein product [Closterium sp. Yama58-4]|nr:unnamed protein product [Closterium sp. Yama58-4]